MTSQDSASGCLTMATVNNFSKIFWHDSENYLEKYLGKQLGEYVAEAMERRMPLSQSSEGCGQTGDNSQEANMTCGPSLDLRAQILQLLNTDLNCSSIKSLQCRLEIMQKSSYYLEIYRHDPPPDPKDQQVYMSNSNLLALIDPSGMQRMKVLTTDLVKVRLALLEEYYAQIVKGRDELMAVVNQCDPDLVDYRDQQELQKKILYIIQTLSDFDGTLTARQVYLKHRLIPHEIHIATGLPRLSTSLLIKMPVMFNRDRSYTTWNAAMLHWEVIDQEQPEGDQQFEVHCRMLQPIPADEVQMFTFTCGDYSLQVNNLMPERSYQFSVKRDEACNLVYASWSELMILQTKAAPTG